jgi:hypothetical protein
MTKQGAIDYLKCIGYNPEKVRFSVIDYSQNPLAPEKEAYRVHFTEYGQRRKCTIYPETVGAQFSY